MKRLRKILTLLLSFALLGIFSAGCGTYTPPAEENPPQSELPPVDNDDGQEKPPEEEGGAFTVKLIYNAQAFVPDNKVSAIFTSLDDKNSQPVSAVFNAAGVATMDGLDGDYQVTLSDMPQKNKRVYCYNANIYTVTNAKKSVDITLYTVRVTSGRGTENTPYSMTGLGIYSATLKSKDDAIWFQYSPKQGGTYCAESWMDITANVVNPILDVYNSNSSWHSSKPAYTMDGGGVSSTFTKNFKLFMSINEDEIGGVYTFTIRSNTIAENAYPVSFFFNLSYVGEYNREDYEYGDITPQESFPEGRIATPAGIFKEVGETAPRHILQGENFERRDDGYYYEKSTGKKLYCKINQDPAVIGPTNTGSGFMDGDVMMHGLIIWDEKAQIGYNYRGFIEKYAEHTDAVNGVYPVNDELKTFLQRYSLSQRLFMDGEGYAEKLYGETGYHSSEDDQWLWACGLFY